MKNIALLPPYVINETPALPFSQTVDWGVEKLNIQKLHSLGITGKGIKVGVLDTGCDLSHPDLNIHSSKDFTGGETAQDEVGHGTHCAGIIAAQDNNTGTLGVAPECELHIYKVLGSHSGTLNDVAQGVREAADDGMDIINMSLGSTENAKILQDAVNYAMDKGCIIVVSSGNSGREQKYYPASYPGVYTVGAINAQCQMSTFSSYGQQMDFVSPGERILSTYLKGSYAILSGTSMAAPFASGCLALMKQAGVDMSYDNITKSVIDIEDPGFDILSGFGILNPHFSIDALKPTKPVGSVKPASNEQIIQNIQNIQTSIENLKKLLKI